MANYIIKDGVKYKMEQSLFDNSNFKEDMQIFLTLFVVVPAIAVGGVYFDKFLDTNKSNKPQTESFKEKTKKIVDTKNTFDATYLFKQQTQRVR